MKSGKNKNTREAILLPIGILKKIALVVVISVFIYSCGNKSTKEENKVSIKVPVISLENQSQSILNEYPASIQAISSIEIRPQVEGVLEKIYVDEGEKVAKGQLLFKINDRPFIERLNQASANLEAAKSALIKSEQEVTSNGQINVSLYYKSTNDIVEPVSQHIIENGNIVMLQTFENIGRNKSFGTNFYGSLKFLKRFHVKANLDVYTYSNSPYKHFFTSIKDPNKTFIIYKTFVGMDVNLGKGYTFDSYLFYDSPQRTFQGEFSAFNLLNISFKKKILKEEAVVGITIVDPFNNIKNLGNYSASPNFIQTGNFSIPFRSFGLSLSWQFGKNRSNAYQTKDKQIRNDDQKIST